MMSLFKKIFLTFHSFLTVVLLLWLFFQPVLEEALAWKTEKALFQMVIEHPLFESLASQEQQSIRGDYETALVSSYSHKNKNLFSLFLKNTSFWILLWLLLSISICFIAWRNAESLFWIAWGLPLLALFYCSFSFFTPSYSSSFFPTKAYVLEKYGESNTSFWNQNKALLKSWHRYIVAEWAPEETFQNSLTFEEKLNSGFFYFNVARLKKIREKNEQVMTGFVSSSSFFRLSLYCLWNVFFAWYINKKSAVVLNQSSCA